MANLGADDFVTVDYDLSSFNVTFDDSSMFGEKTNVQCESCHGPSSEHTMATQPGEVAPSIPLEAESCGTCHQDAHHPYIEEWMMSSHAGSADHPVSFLQDRFRNDSQCAGCHTVQGFIQFVGTTPADTVNIIPDVVAPGDDALPIVCASCHDPHDASKKGQLRLEAPDLCVKCHNPEDAQPGEAVHHATSSMWTGEGAIQFPGFTFRTESPHQTTEPTASNACISCHVFMTPFVNDTIPAATGHTFNPRIESCGQVEGCHVNGFDEVGPAGEFDFRRRQTITDSLVNVLTNILTDVTPEDSMSQTFAEAVFNLEFVTSSGSRGIHNPFYAEDILTSTIEVASTTFTTAIEPISSSEIPQVFVLDQNYPNPFNPTTTIEFDVPQQTQIKLTVYNAIGQLVSTLVNEEMTPGRYKVDFSAANLSSGLYVYTLESADVSLTKTMTLLK